MTAIRENVPLTETFTADSLDNYSTYQATSNATAMGRTPGAAPYAYGLSTQKHVDIRTFNAPQTALVNQVRNPSFEHDAVGVAPAGWNTPSALNPTNLVTEPDFSHRLSGQAPAVWSGSIRGFIGASPTAMSCNGGPYTDNYVTITCPTSGTNVGISIPLGSVASGQPVTAVVQIEAGKANQAVGVTMEDNLAGNGPATATATIVASLTTQTFTLTWTPTALSANAMLYVYAVAPTAGDVFYVRRSIVSLGAATPTWFSGDTPEALWNGTAGQSTSSRFPAVSTAWADTGAQSLHLVTTALTGTNQATLFMTGPDAGPGGVSGTLGWNISRLKSLNSAGRFAFKVNAVSGNFNAYLEFWCYDVNGNFIAAPITPTSSAGTTGVRFNSGAVTLPAGTYFFRVAVVLFCVTAGTLDINVDSFGLFFDLTTAPPFFSGDMSGYQWTGTPGNSTSQTLSLYSNSEQWTASGSVGFTVGPQSSLNHWSGLQASLPTGTTTFTSTAGPIDLTQIPNGNIVLALPGYPASSINATQSMLGFSDGTQTVWRTFASSTTTLASGNTTATWPVSAITGLNTSAVTEILLSVVATTPVTFQAMALRLVGPEWIVSNVDFDTWNGELRQPISANGDSTYVVPTSQQLPIIWRSATTPGVDDPRPINGEFGVLFNTGSQTHQNSFTLYMREETQAYLTQLDLEGSTQASLTGQPQPTEGVSQYSPRTIGDLENRSMGDLDTRSMIDLERIENPVYQSWISFTLQWGSSTLIQIDNSSNQTSGFPGYQYTPVAFANNTMYLMICNLTDNTARMQIWSLDQSTHAMITPVFDTTVIPDSSMFPRQAGRVGWTASLLDGDTYIKSIRPRNLMFAEYKSKPLESITPVSGARLYAQYTNDAELFSEWSANADTNGNKPILSADQSRFVANDPTQQSTKVQVTNPSAASITPQGIISNPLSPPGDNTSGITNFDQLSVDFSVWVPELSTVAPTLTLYQNLVPNPSFEHDTVGSAPTGWSSASGTTVFAVQNTWASVGTKSLRMTMPSAAAYPNGITGTGPSQFIPVSSNQFVATRATFNLLNPNTRAYLNIAWFDVSGSQMGLFTQWQSGNATGVVTGELADIVPPPGAVYLNIQCNIINSDTVNAQTIDCYLDEVMIQIYNQEGQYLSTYGDGDTSGWSWEGTLGNSASQGYATVSNPVITAALINEQNSGIPINLPALTPGQWSEVSLTRPVLPPYPMSGLYRLALYYGGTVPATFWVGGVSITEPAVKWDARSVTSDPWNANTAPWTPFHDKVNSDVDGIKFTTVGATTQVRGQALRQDAAILSNPTLVPQYAQLGRLVWPEDAPTLTPLHVPTFITSNSGRTFTFGVPATGGNMIPNPSFEYDTTGSSPTNWITTNADLVAGATPTVVTTQHELGTKSLQVVCTAVLQGVGTQLTPPTSSGLQAGTPYIFSAWCKGNAGGEAIQLILGGAYPNSNSADYTLTTAWTQYSVVWTPTSTVTSGAYAEVRDSGTTMTYFVDGAMVTQGSSITPYIDGDSPGYTWSGTTGFSAAIPSTGPGNFYWSFGDGTYATGSTATHTYPSYLASGTQFTVTLTYVNYLGQAVSALPYLVTLP